MKKSEPKSWIKLCIIEIIIILFITLAILLIKKYFDKESTNKVALKEVLVNKLN